MARIVIATDVDGTLTDNRNILDLEAIKLLRELKDLGAEVILVSSHAFPALSTLAEYLGFRYFVAETGGCGGEPWNPLFIHAVTNRDRILNILRDNGYYPTGSNRFRLADISIRPPSDPDKAVIEIKRLLDDFDVDVVYSGFAIHIHRKGVDKGYGLRKLLDILSIDGTVIAIGDGLNDVPLFRVADFSIAPINAPEPLRRIATVTLPYGFSMATLHALKNIVYLFKFRKFDLGVLENALRS